MRSSDFLRKSIRISVISVVLAVAVFFGMFSSAYADARQDSLNDLRSGDIFYSTDGYPIFTDTGGSPATWMQDSLAAWMLDMFHNYREELVIEYLWGLYQLEWDNRSLYENISHSVDGLNVRDTSRNSFYVGVNSAITSISSSMSAFNSDLGTIKGLLSYDNQSVAYWVRSIQSAFNNNIPQIKSNVTTMVSHLYGIKDKTEALRIFLNDFYTNGVKVKNTQELATEIANAFGDLQISVDGSFDDSGIVSALNDVKTLLNSYNGSFFSNLRSSFSNYFNSVRSDIWDVETAITDFAQSAQNFFDNWVPVSITSNNQAFDGSQIYGVLQQYLPKLARLDSILAYLSDISNDLNTGFSDTFYSILDFLFGGFSPNEFIGMASDLVQAAQDRFPFALIGTFTGLLTLFDVNSSVPQFDIPFPTGSGAYSSVHVDFSTFEDLAEVIRFGCIVLLIVGLLFNTKKFIYSGRE